MKLKSLFYISALVLPLMLTSCSKSKKDTDKFNKDISLIVKQPEMEVTKNDTDEVIALANNFLDRVKTKDFDGAMAMLHYLNKDKLENLPKDLARKEHKALTMFPVYGYRVDYIKFFRETDSEIKFSLLIQDPTKVKHPAVIGGMFRPVRQQGVWYLTLADTGSDTIQSQLDTH
jgi:hypothetical protein